MAEGNNPMSEKGLHPQPSESLRDRLLTILSQLDDLEERIEKLEGKSKNVPATEVS